MQGIDNSEGFALSRRMLLLAGGALATGCVHGRSRPATPMFIDGLSFLPERLEDIGSAELSAMICDVSQVQEIRDAQGFPRYLRTFEVNDLALDTAKERLKASPQAFVALKGSEIGTRPGCAAFLQFQSCEMIGEDLSRLAYFHAKGLRVLQFTHHNDNLFAGGAIEPYQSGLTPLGAEGLAEMNRLRLLPDVSHGSEATMIEAAQRSTTPIVLSHGACKAIVDHPRCASDRAIKAIADTGGVMGIFMMSFWLTKAAAPRVDDLLAQIRHVMNVGGNEAVGIANDFPMGGQPNLLKLGNKNREGVKEYLDWWREMRRAGVPGFESEPQHVVIPELNRLDRMRKIYEALERARFPAVQIERVLGGNWRHVLNEVLT